MTAGATLLTVAVPTLAGYVCWHWRSRPLAASAFWLIALRQLSPIVRTLPMFPIVNRLGLNDTHLVLMILYATFIVSLGTLVMRRVIDQIPRELDEAALTDGATRWQILVRIILPVCTQGMVAVAVFVIVYAWNEFLLAFLFTSRTARTAPLVLSEMLNTLNGTEWGEVFAAATLKLAPTDSLGPLGLAMDSRGDLYVGEVSYAQWPFYWPDQPAPESLRCLRKLRKI